MGLCLSRRRNESILINGVCSITVARIQGGKVVLNIEGPKEYRITRPEMITKRLASGEKLCDIETKIDRKENI